MSKTSASVSSGVPNTEKQMKALRLRRRAFIVSRCLEPLVKHEARVFEITSQPSFVTNYDHECNAMIFCFIRQVDK